MSQLSPNQIASLAYQAGFRGMALTLATAVALAESSGNTDAYNPETAAGTPQGMGSYGLWQIYRNAHPEFGNANLYDPAINAQAAYSVYRAAGNSFTPWSTYNNGSALNYARQLQGLSYTTGGSEMGGGTGGVVYGNVIPGDSGYPASSGAVQQQAQGSSPLVSLNLLPQNVTDFLASPVTGMRLAVGAIGFILVIFGLLMLAGTVGRSYTENVQKPMARQAVKLAASGA